MSLHRVTNRKIRILFFSEIVKIQILETVKTFSFLTKSIRDVENRASKSFHHFIEPRMLELN